jgi:hypothetical protein
LNKFYRGNVGGKKKGKETQVEDAPRRRQAFQDYVDRENFKNAFREAAPAGHQKIQQNAPVEEIETGPSCGRQERPHDVAVWIVLQVRKGYVAPLFRAAS